MCGVAGIVDLAPPDGTAEPVSNVVARMLERLRHRGPDDQGIWVDPEIRMGIGNRRLAVIELSDSGHQPMVSPAGRYVLSFNGEIYNHALLREQLQPRGYPFVGRSDTEVLLAAISEWGLASTLGRINGMFALAVWDRRERRLHLVRDRLGEKPMYYGLVGSRFVFASELGALVAALDTRPDIDRDALALFVRHSYVPAPHTIYAGIHKLAAGELASLDIGKEARSPVVRQYWSARQIVEAGVRERIDENQAVDELESLLMDAVRLRMASDVPLGAFLSGGVDSSTVVALMQAQAAAPVRTFTIGFHDPGIDEAPWARAVASHLGADHTELYVTADDALGVIPRVPAVYDEPFADPSQVPTMLLASLARREVTVSLSGDGGDELFGGYARYFTCDREWRQTRRPPRRLRSTLAALLPAGHAGSSRHLIATTREALYLASVSKCADPLSIVVGASEPATALTDASRWADLDEFVPWMMYVDLLTYLPDYILTKVDRATMAVSLESRAPFLDHRVVEFAWRLPPAFKLRGPGKWIVRQLLRRYLPNDLVERPKGGFDPPLAAWLRGPLREWADDLLCERRLRDEGYLDPGSTRALWDEHVAGRRDRSFALWGLVMFQAWHETHRT